VTAADFRARFPFVIDTRVEWGDLDEFGHVNNTYYFRYFERVRMAFGEHLGLRAWMRAHGVGPILHSTRCRFRSALGYPDTLLVGTAIDELAEDRFNMLYGIFSETQGLLAAEGEGLIVCFDYRRNAKTPIPAPLLEALRPWLRTGGG
jgi:acyl-CoA thioester hydrolase